MANFFQELVDRFGKLSSSKPVSTPSGIPLLAGIGWNQQKLSQAGGFEGGKGISSPPPQTRPKTRISKDNFFANIVPAAPEPLSVKTTTPPFSPTYEPPVKEEQGPIDKVDKALSEALDPLIELLSSTLQVPQATIQVAADAAVERLAKSGVATKEQLQSLELPVLLALADPSAGAPFEGLSSAAKAKALNLSNDLLMKTVTADLSTEELRGALTGSEGATERAVKFVSGLTNEERKDLFSVVRSSEKMELPMTVKTGREPNFFGELFGKKPFEEPGVVRTAPEQELPGYRRAAGQAPAFGLSTEEVEPVGKGGVPEIPPELQPLAEEARKYKSAEEFVRAIKRYEKEGGIEGLRYHGAKGEFAKLSDKPIFLAPDTYSAKSYGENIKSFLLKEGKTLDLQKPEIAQKTMQDIFGSPEKEKLFNQIPETSLVKGEYQKYPRESANDFDDWLWDKYGGVENKALRQKYIDAFFAYGNPSKEMIYQKWNDIIKYAKNKGYDYITHTGEDAGKNYTFEEKIALNPQKTLKEATKSQLTDFYNQAVKGIEAKAPDEALVTPEKSGTGSQAAIQFMKDSEFERRQAEREKLPVVNVERQSQDEAAVKAYVGKGRGINSLDKDTKDAFQKWANTATRLETRGISARLVLRPIEKEIKKIGIGEAIKYQKGEASNVPKEVRAVTDDLLKKETDAGIDVDRVENYIPHYWKDSPEKVIRAFEKYSGTRVNLRPGFSLERLFNNYEEGISEGLTPEYDNLYDILYRRISASEKAIADREFWDYLSKNNLIQPHGYHEEGWGVLDPERFPKFGFRTSEGEVYRGAVSAPAPLAEAINNRLAAPNKALAMAAAVSTKMKNIVMTMGLPFTGINFHGANELAGALIESADHPTLGKTAIYYMFYPRGGTSFIEENLDQAVLASKQGLKLGVEEHSFDSIGNRVLDDAGMLKKATGKLVRGIKAVDRTVYKAFGANLFQKMIPALKLKAWMLFKGDLLRRGMEESEAGRQSALRANKLFGGFNWEQIGRSKDFMNFSRVAIFAPDFWESRLRYGGSLAKSFVSKKDPFRNSYLKAAATIIGSYIVLSAWNKANSRKYMHENPPGHEMDVYLGRDSKGKIIWLRPYGTVIDFIRLPYEVIYSIAKGDLRPLPSIIANRVSTLAQFGARTILNVDWQGNPIFGKTKFGKKQSLLKQATNWAKTMPIPQASLGIGEYFIGDESKFQSASQFLGLPLRFNKPPKKAVISLPNLISPSRIKIPRIHLRRPLLNL